MRSFQRLVVSQSQRSVWMSLVCVLAVSHLHHPRQLDIEHEPEPACTTGDCMARCATPGKSSGE
eukprot:2992086-Rhodomonas_salina.5